MGDKSWLNTIKKLNDKNYSMWQTCIETYLESQDLLKIVKGNEVALPLDINAAAYKKWKIKKHRESKQLKEHRKPRKKHSSMDKVEEEARGAQEGQEVESSSSNNYRRCNDLCFNCGKRGHFARDYRYKKGSVQGNVATSREEENHNEKEWDMEASCATVEIEVEVKANQVALSASNQSKVDYSKNWIIDSRAASRMTGDEKKLLNLSEYKGNRVVVTTDDTRLSIKQIGDAIEGTLIMKGEKKNSVYVMSAEITYVDRTSKNDTANLWHARLGHDSKFKGKEPLQLVHLDVFGKVKQSSIGGAHYMVTFIDDYLRNVVFDEASSWWSPQEVVLPDFKELEEKVQEKLGEDTCRLLDTQEVVEKEKEITLERTVSPWQTGVQEPMTEETRQGEVEEAEQQPEQQPRCSTRERKPNPKYVNIALIEASPQKYASDLLKKFGMLECKPISTPMEMNARHCSYKGKDLTSATMYQQLVESLIYLTLSRSDMSFAVGVVSKFMQNPKKPHLEAVHRILRYVKRTLDYGILYKSGTKCKVLGYCEADYVGCHDTKRSTTGYVFNLGSRVISWCSKRQPTISLSTTEVEYRAAAVEIEMQAKTTDEQAADIFTKGLNVGKLEKFRKQLGMMPGSKVGAEGEC
ncbi:hypothetical protein SLEP1_g2621 [Rubroshorea leprosula]|uniref:CCHC-type domain-containing protein n=1 Tax=Rubroshorea leprosula TaxID=152421 RepID=A0AAV5HS97_9ROSI|nr:hypothetical protein SLEP1_g2621 [Rubroshorea leprosula]